MINFTLHLLSVALCSMMASCASGTNYADAKASGALTPHQGKGMVLIYRTPGFVSAAYKPFLYANQAQLPSRLQRGGFCSYEAAPGPLNLAYSKSEGESTAKTRRAATIANAFLGGVVAAMLAPRADIEAHRKVGLDLTVLPNQTHFIVMGGAGGDLEVAPKADAEEAIQSCHWLNPSAR